MHIPLFMAGNVVKGCTLGTSGGPVSFMHPQSTLKLPQQNFRLAGVGVSALTEFGLGNRGALRDCTLAAKRIPPAKMK